jgi:hypothetical protein
MKQLLVIALYLLAAGCVTESQVEESISPTMARVDEPSADANPVGDGWFECPRTGETRPDPDSEDGLPHLDPELELTMPSSIDGTPVLTISGRGVPRDRTGSLEAALLNLLGARDDDYSWAMGMPADGSDVQIQAFRVAGRAPQPLLAAFLETFREGTIKLNLGGDETLEQRVEVDGDIVAVFRGAGRAAYVRAVDDIVFVVWGIDDGSGLRTISALPCPRA